MSGRVVNLWQYRMRRERDLARRMRLQEREAALSLYPRVQRNVSDVIPHGGAWAGLSPALLAEFSGDDPGPDAA